MDYVGRFAPSPTGPLHFGSIVAATASYLDARSAGGKWLVRMEDVDEARTVKGAASSILRMLEDFGMEWNGEVLYQSARKAHYRDAMSSLGSYAYPCSCTRREIGGIYRGTCRNGTSGAARSVRLRVDEGITGFHDAIQGEYSQNLEREVGDFVLLRADGYYAYQLAVVVDDMMQGVNHVVRGADLLDSTPRQIYLQDRLRVQHPVYAHVPVAVNGQNEKLSKQTKAQPALPNAETLYRALMFLGQNPPADTDLPELWNWALRSWDLNKVPKKTMEKA